GNRPWVDGNFIRRWAAKGLYGDVVVFSRAGGVEPLLAVYSKNCIKPLEESLFSGVLKVQDFLSGLKAKVYEYAAETGSDSELPAYFNVNTPQDYSQVLIRVKSSPCRVNRPKRFVYPAPERR